MKLMEIVNYFISLNLCSCENKENNVDLQTQNLCTMLVNKKAMNDWGRSLNLRSFISKMDIITH